jgi:NADH-quinone oxidoreductase subunit A
LYGTIFLIILFAAIAFAAGDIGIEAIRKGIKNLQKGQPYECGIPVTGSPWNQFNVVLSLCPDLSDF